MFVSKDGTVTGSIDHSKLGEVEPKTDEARAQLDALRTEAQFGQEQAARDAERLAEQHEAQAAQLRGDDDDADGKRTQAERKSDADRQRAADKSAAAQKPAATRQTAADQKPAADQKRG